MTTTNKFAPLLEGIKKRKKVTFFLGAGVSTSCGIPDFRSPKTGLYANLKSLNLPYPEAVFDIDYFRDDPKAFYTLCAELYPGKFCPSDFHFLLRLFQEKDLLHRVYTQNIDTLETIAGVKPENVVAAHGSFSDNHCIDCSTAMSKETLKKHMDDKSSNGGIPLCTKCKGYVKPDIVFFGEGLPTRFFDMWEADSENVEIAIVAGTSLSVYPFAGLPQECNDSALRVLVNNEMVGDFKASKRQSDLVFITDCDAFARELVSHLGWDQQFRKLIDAERKKFINATSAVDESYNDPSDKQTETKEEVNGAIVSSVVTTQEGAAENSDELTEELEEKLEKLNL